jgi:uncharacterized protein (TIGR03437 family)
MKSIQIVFGLLLAAGAATAQQYTISTVAGIGTVQGYFGDTGPANQAQLDFPFKVAVDSKGNLYLADYYTYVVREVSAGIINTIAGDATPGFEGDNGPGIQAEISFVHGLATDSNGSLYIADTSNARVRVVNISTTGNIYTFAGNGTSGYTGDGGKAVNAELNSPAGLVVDPAGNVYIADYGNSTVRKVDTSGMITTVAGTGTWGNSGDGGPANKATLAHPVALAIDTAGNIYIADPGNLNVRKITTDGNIHTIISKLDVESIAVDAAGSIYYPNYLNSTIEKILSNGTQFTIAGNGTVGFSGDGGPATAAQLNMPYGVAVDSSGNVYVADFANMAIRQLTPAVSTVTAVNAASGVGLAVSPGEIIALYGQSLGPPAPATQQPDENGYYGTQLAGATVSFNGVNAPLTYVSASQINAIVPYEVANTTMTTIQVNYQGQNMASQTLPVVVVAPGIFTANSSGVGPASVINQDGSVNSATNQALPGTVIAFFLTGEGQTNPGGVDGKTTPLPPAHAPAPQQAVAVFLNGQQTQVPYAAEAPGLVAGIMQVNAQVPPNVVQNPSTSPVAVPLLMIVGPAFTQTGITVYVAP